MWRRVTATAAADSYCGGRLRRRGPAPFVICRASRLFVPPRNSGDVLLITESPLFWAAPARLAGPGRGQPQ
jgi:hypothetical protein